MLRSQPKGIAERRLTMRVRMSELIHVYTTENVSFYQPHVSQIRFREKIKKSSCHSSFFRPFNHANYDQQG